MLIAATVRRSSDQARWRHLVLLADAGFLHVSPQHPGHPFLKSELDLSYRAVGLHWSAIAAGMIVVVGGLRHGPWNQETGRPSMTEPVPGRN